MRFCYASTGVMRYAIYDPNDPRKGKIMPDPKLGQIVLAEGATITRTLAAAGQPPPGSIVWDRHEARIAYVVPGGLPAR